MKLFDTGNEVTSEGLGASQWSKPRIGEFPNHMLLRGQLHEKNTLTPKFMQFPDMGAYRNNFRLNKGQEWGFDYDDSNIGSTVWYGAFGFSYGPCSPWLQWHCRGTNAMFKNYPSEYHISSTHPNLMYIYYGSDRNNQKLNVHSVDKLEHQRQGNGSSSYIKQVAYDEDLDYIYYTMTADFGKNQHNVKINKSSLEQAGYGPYHARLIKTPIWKDGSTGNTIFAYNIFNYSSTRDLIIGFFQLSRGMTQYTNSFDNGQTHDGGSSAPDGVKPFFGWDGRLTANDSGIQNGYNFSDGSTAETKSAQYLSKVPAVYNSGSLLSENGYVRVWTANVANDGSIEIIRCNVPVDQSKTDLSNGGDYANNDYLFDVRKCTINNLPAPLNFDDLFSAVGSSSYGMSNINLSYFADGAGKEYLLLDTACPYSAHHSTTRGGKDIYVFEILDNNASGAAFTKDIGGLSLDFKQHLEWNEDSLKFGLIHFVNSDPQTMIVCHPKSESHEIYSWNTSAQQYETSANLSGRITAIGEDSLGRIWTQKHTPETEEYHVESIDLPARIEVIPAQTEYAYNGSNISSTVGVSVYNHLGNRINGANVSLQIVGDGMEFDGGAKSTNVTSDNSQAVDVNITKTSATLAQINASILV